ncbi:glycosyltransferase family 4 protein [Lysobacter sp. HA35]
MRLLFVSKRAPQGRDLAARPYGRFHHLPRELAKRGHDVRIVLCGHRREPPADQSVDGMHVRTVDARSLGPVGLARALTHEARAVRPDWVIGCSDAWYGVLARRMARAGEARLAIDAYDNYEAYMPWNVPLHLVWRKSLAAADLVTAAGPQLADLLGRSRPGKRVEILPMAADPEFRPASRATCRMGLGLPMDRPLIGYVGSWTRSRGSYLILDALDEVRRRRGDVRLAVSGRPPAYVASHEGVTATGYLADAQLPALFAALDVACVVTANTRFGRYSYPAKLCEAMACGVPVAATSTHAVSWMLGDAPQHLSPVGDATGLADRICSLLDRPVVRYPPPPNWHEVAVLFEAFLSGA